MINRDESRAGSIRMLARPQASFTAREIDVRHALRQPSRVDLIQAAQHRDSEPLIGISNDVGLNWYSVPGVKFSARWRASNFTIASFRSAPSSRGAANSRRRNTSRSPLVWVSRCRIVSRLP